MPKKIIVIYVKQFYQEFFDKLRTMQDADTKLSPLISRAVKSYVDKPDLPRLRNHLIEHPEDIVRYEGMIKELKLKRYTSVRHVD